jgi:hypothetical protein
MAKSIRIALALLCMVCLLALLIAPLVDPPSTRLLSESFQLLMLCWLVTATCFLIHRSVDRSARLSLFGLRRTAIPLNPPPKGHPLTLNCILRH